jgi:5-methyltetrahydrofolate--homocysteine methyltransferase
MMGHDPHCKRWMAKFRQPGEESAEGEGGRRRERRRRRG